MKHTLFEIEHHSRERLFRTKLTILVTALVAIVAFLFWVSTMLVAFVELDICFQAEDGIRDITDLSILAAKINESNSEDVIQVMGNR